MYKAILSYTIKRYDNNLKQDLQLTHLEWQAFFCMFRTRLPKQTASFASTRYKLQRARHQKTRESTVLSTDVTLSTTTNADRMQIILATIQALHTVNCVKQKFMVRITHKMHVYLIKMEFIIIYLHLQICILL